MKTLISDPIAGALAGFAVGFLASINLAYLGLDVSGWPAIGFGIVGAVAGYVVGSCHQSRSVRARTIATWCVRTAFAVGLAAFLVGFAGPIVLRPDLPQGPLLGIFCTGPLGVLAGAILGTLIGIVVPLTAAQQ